MIVSNTLIDNENRCITTHAPGKLILFGEYLVLLGYGAVGVPIQRKTSATLRIQNVDDLTIHSSMDVSKQLYVHIKKICAMYNIMLPQGSIVIESTIPSNAGFGSSAALCVCLSRLIVAYNYAVVSSTIACPLHGDDLVWLIAHNLEHFFHTEASGLDTCLCTRETPLLLEPVRQELSCDIFSLPLSYSTLDLHLEDHILYSFINRDTAQNIATTLEQIKSVLTTGNDKKKGYLKKLIHHHTLVLDLCKQKTNAQVSSYECIHAIAQHAASIHELLSKLNISHPRIDAILQNVRKQTLGGKISGAGSGGAFFMLCNSATRSHSKIQRHIPNTLFIY